MRDGAVLRARLDGVREGDTDCREAQVRQQVAQRVHCRQRQDADYDVFIHLRLVEPASRELYRAALALADAARQGLLHTGPGNGTRTAARVSTASPGVKNSYLGRLLDTEEPHGASNAGADEELDKGARDRERVRLEHLLVPDVEEDVGGVPEREKEA